MVKVKHLEIFKTFACLLEGPEGVKWELGFAYFCTGKMGFGSPGLGITNTKQGMGNMSRNYTVYVVNAQSHF